MQKGFTLIEVSILFVIFLIVAFLVAPLSLDDTMQAKNISRWKNVQQDFINIMYSIETNNNRQNFITSIESALDNEIKNSIDNYKILFLNGTYPSKTYKFNNLRVTYSNAVIATKFFEEPIDNLIGLLMYDVNGKKGPNMWGKDVFGLNIYQNNLEAFGKNLSIEEQKKDCSKLGTGLYCSNYYLIGGSFD